MDIFWESLQNWTIFRGHFYVFKSRYRTGDIVGAVKISNSFGVLEIPYFFW